MKKNKSYFFTISLLIVTILPGCSSDQNDKKVYEGVVTMTNIPAKVIQINELIEDPEPGKSYIGEKKMIFEVDEMPEVVTNWTILKVEYIKYPQPKTIKYTILSNEQELKVENKVVSLSIVGDLSTYINK